LFRLPLAKRNGGASPVFFVPRTLGRTWGTRPVEVISDAALFCRATAVTNSSNRNFRSRA
jgi:hypothetical protein